MEDASRYRRLVGMFIYLTGTRSDLSFAVSVISQFMQHPRVSHWKAVLRILRYLKGQPNKGLMFTRHNKENVLEI